LANGLGLSSSRKVYGDLGGGTPKLGRKRGVNNLMEPELLKERKHETHDNL
jgi:hypothetical protein